MELLLQTTRTQNHACRMGAIRRHAAGFALAAQSAAQSNV